MSFLFRRAESRAIDASAFITDAEEPSSISQDGLLSVAPAYSAIKLISETIATLPLHGYSSGGGSRKRIALPAWLAEPVDGSTTGDFVQRGAVSALTHGNAWGLKSGVASSGVPSGVTWLKPQHMRVDESGQRPRYLYGGQEIESWRLVHIPAVVVPGSVVAVAPIKAFALTFDAARRAAEASRDWSKNRAVPGVHMHNNQTTIKDDVADTLSVRAQQKIRNGKPFVTGKDWDLNVLQIPAGDAAFLESIKAGATTIASIFNLPPEMIGGTTGASLTYNTVEGNTDWFLMFTIRAWVTKFEAAFSRLMPRPQYVKFNIDAFKRVDTTTRFGTYRTAREIGLRSVNELRALEDLEPIAGGDNYAPLAVQQKLAEGDPSGH